MSEVPLYRRDFDPIEKCPLSFVEESTGYSIVGSQRWFRTFVRGLVSPGREPGVVIPLAGP